MKYVLGSNGQLGTCLQNLCHENADYTFLTRKNIDLGESLQGPLKNLPLTRDDVIINCAAYTAVDNAEDESDLADRINRTAVQELAEYCKNISCHLIHISTDYVFDGNKCTPYSEGDLTNPLGSYGRTKQEGEKAIENSNCDYTIIRTSWLYSEYFNNFFKTMCKLSNRESLNVVNDQFGTPTYAPDLANIILKIAENPSSHNKQIYHYSGDGECSWYDFACKIMSLIGSNCQVNPVPTSEYPTKAPRPKYTVLSKEKIKSALNIEIPHWKDSLKKCIENKKRLNL